MDLKSLAYTEISEKFKKLNFIIFGAGLIGKDLSVTIRKIGKLRGFVDNDEQKQKDGVNGYEVFSVNKVLEASFDSYIIIAASKKNTVNLISQLRDLGLKKGKDFCTCAEFLEYYMPLQQVYYNNKTFLGFSQISITERCTLKCKKCAHACFAVSSDSEDMSIERVYNSADTFFSKYDYVHEFVLIGGEPFLYKKLSDIIEYIGEKYRDRIGIFSITTNGTIIPTPNVIDVINKYSVLIRVSNYSKTLPRLVGKYRRLQEMFDEYAVDYVIGSYEAEWMDYGFGFLDRKATKEEMREVFAKCRTQCHEVRDNKFYFCVMARAVSENLNYNLGDDDYLDLSQLTSHDYKEKLLEYQMGYFEKGYLEMCNYCYGADAVEHPIPAAEQN